MQKQRQGAVTPLQAAEAADITKQAGAAACEMARVNSSMRGGRVLTAVEAHELYRVADDIAQIAGRLNRLCMDIIAARTDGEKGATA